MNNFKAVYRILSQCEKDLDNDHVDIGRCDAESLCISENRWYHIIQMMHDVGYIKGIRMTQYTDGTINCDCRDIQITLKGLEYLQENSIMRKLYRGAKGVSDLIT